MVKLSITEIGVAIANTLPDDVLYLIFLYALQIPTAISEIALDPLTVVPLNLAAVCRSWRTLISSQPSLRSTIHIDQGYTHLHSSVLRYVENWFEKSGDAPLDMDLKLRRSTSDPIYDELIALILPQRQRWRDIEFHINSSSIVRSGQPVTVKCSPSTISVKLFLIGTHPRSPYMSLDLSSCVAASQLCVLEIDKCVDLVFPQPRDSLYLPNLRTLAFNTDLSTDITDSYALLSACPNIETLRIYGEGKCAPYQYASYCVILRRLAHLSISASTKASAFYVLECLSCPSLRSFSFHAHYEISKGKYKSGRIVIISHLEIFTSFFIRSAEDSNARLRLTELKLKYHVRSSAIPPESYGRYVVAEKELLSLFDDLEKLYLRGLVISNELVEDLTVRADNKGGGRGRALLCPSLSELRLISNETTGLQMERVEEMVVSRWKSTPGLRVAKLRMSGCDDLSKESERVKACVEEGLVILSAYE